MTTEDLEQLTLEYIQNLYKRKYIGKIKVVKLNPIGYSVKLGLISIDQPISIYAELEDEQFLKFLKQELKDRRLSSTYFGELNMVYPYECNPINKSCSCHDKR